MNVEEKIEEWKQYKEVLAILLFGSEKEGNTHEHSDIDIAIILDPYKEEVEDELMLEGGRFDVVVLNKVGNPILIYEALKGKPLYIRDKKRFIEIGIDLLKRFWWSLPLLKRFGVIEDEV